MTIALAALCIVLAIAAMAIRSFRLASERHTCANNLNEISVALHCYHDFYGTFPPAITYDDNGRPLHSWRVLILPWMVGNEGARLFSLYDLSEPWNASPNRSFRDNWRSTSVIRRAYQCPAANDSPKRMFTNYLMLIDDRPGSENGPPNRPGAKPLSIHEKSSVIVIEIAESDISWMEPRDVVLSELSFVINDRNRVSPSSCHGGAFILHVDGGISFFDKTVSPQRVEQVLSNRLRPEEQ